MTGPALGDLLERVFVAGIAITTRALSEATPELDLTFPQWRALLVVGEEGDGATVSAIASRVGVTVPATSRQLRRLAKRRLVEVRRDEHDRRALRVQLTSEGAAARDRILDFRRQRIATAIGPLHVSPGSVRDLARVVDAFAGDR